jgi:Arc/MetJ-type ribon-helix-helix transcriptional regulator
LSHDEAYGYHMVIARTQTLVQLTPELLKALDEYRARTGASSRSEVIREAIARLLSDDREAQIDRQIVEAYRRRPQEAVWGAEAARRLVEADPWK